MSTEGKKNTKSERFELCLMPFEISFKTQKNDSGKKKKGK
jgi:hypothetical protein